MRKKFLAVLFWAVIFCVQAQIAPCTGGSNSELLCYGDFENFNVQNQNGFINDVNGGLYTYYDLNEEGSHINLSNNQFGNSSNYVVLCSNVMEAQSNIPPGYGSEVKANHSSPLVLPLKRSFEPCEKGTFSFKYYNKGVPKNAHVARVYFLRTNPIITAANQGLSFEHWSSLNNNVQAYDYVDITLNNPETGWINYDVSFSNTSDYDYKYVMFEFRAFSLIGEQSSCGFFDDMQFKVYTRDPRVTVSQDQTGICNPNSQLNVNLKVHGLPSCLPSNKINWQIWSGDNNSGVALSNDRRTFTVRPNVTTQYKLTVNLPGSSTYIRYFTVYVGAQAGNITIDNQVWSPSSNQYVMKLSLNDYVGDHVTWYKQVQYSSGNWSGAFVIDSGSLPGHAHVYEPNSLNPRRVYYAKVNCHSGGYAYTKAVLYGTSSPKSRTLSTEESKQLIEKGNEIALKVYPNPTKGKLKIDIKDDAIISCDFMDITGRKLFSKTLKGSEEISLESYPKGIYLIKFIVNGKITTEKIILE